MSTNTQQHRRPRRTARKAKISKVALGRHVIVRAALAEIDARGLAKFNLRSLAARLDVYPTAIYWYVPTKNHLLAEVAAAVFRNLMPPHCDTDWRGYLRQLFTRYRASVRRHPNVAPLVGAHLIGNLSIELDFVEGILSALTQAGLRDAALVAGYNAIIATLVGYVVQEFSPLPERGTARWQASVRQRLQGLDEHRYPQLTRHLPQLANKAFILRWQNGAEAPLGRSFKQFVELVVAGIEALAARQD